MMWRGRGEWGDTVGPEGRGGTVRAEGDGVGWGQRVGGGGGSKDADHDRWDNGGEEGGFACTVGWGSGRLAGRPPSLLSCLKGGMERSGWERRPDIAGCLHASP